MEKGVYVKDIKRGDSVNGVFVVTEAECLKTRRNEPWWKLVLADKTGRLPANIWAPLSGRYDDIPKGSLVAVEGQCEVYKDRPQVNIRGLELLDLSPAELDNLSDFIPAGLHSPSALFRDLRAICRKELAYPPLRELLDAILSDSDLRKQLLAAPAAKSVHQAYAGGLLEHTLNVARICIALSDLYPFLDRQLLLAGAILHDLGKIREYSSGLLIDYTQAGHLIGHTILGLEIIAPFLAASALPEPLKEHLRHLILSHHGEFAYGAARLPQTAEAFALHYADNLDAKISACLGAFPEAAERPCWSARLPWLERSVLLPVRAAGYEPESSQERTAEGASGKTGHAQGTLNDFIRSDANQGGSALFQ